MTWVHTVLRDTEVKATAPARPVPGRSSRRIVNWNSSQPRLKRPPDAVCDLPDLGCEGRRTGYLLVPSRLGPGQARSRPRGGGSRNRVPTGVMGVAR